jgi:hypothetical protein
MTGAKNFNLMPNWAKVQFKSRGLQRENFVGFLNVSGEPEQVAILLDNGKTEYILRGPLD